MINKLFIKSVFAAAGDVNISNLPNPATNIDVDSSLSDILTGGGFNLLNLIFFFIGIAFFINLIIAGWQYFLSGGDTKKVASASSRINNGFIGMAIVFAAWLLTRLVLTIIGTPDLI